MSETRTKKTEWVKSVLGVTFGGSAPTPSANRPGNWAAARQAWQDANDTVNDQINALRMEIRNRVKNLDPEKDAELELYAEYLTDIAEGGLNVITKDIRVKLMAAVMDIGAGEAAQIRASGAKTLSQIQSFQAFLNSSDKIEVCDGNPFDVPMTIRSTLGSALQGMATVLQAGVG